MVDQSIAIDGENSELARTRHRSPNYPALSLPNALERVERLYAADKRAGAPLEAALKHMGFSGKNGKSTMVLSALKKFGLAEEIAGRLVPTQRAVEIMVLPKDDPRRLKSLKDAALGPEIYRELFEQYSETGLPSDDTLKSELIAFKGFNPSVVEGFVHDFRESLQYALLSDVSAVSFGVEDDVEMLTAPESKTPTTKPSAATSESVVSGATSPKDVKAYSFGLSPEVTAELRITGEFQNDDLELLRDYVEITIRALSRLREKQRADQS